MHERNHAFTFEISDTQRHLRLDYAELRRVGSVVLRAEGHERAWLSLAIVDNATIRRVNRTHLDHDWETDVVSFGMEAGEAGSLAGELVISAEMARDAAAELGTDPTEEFMLYLVHGLLHLCGYDDTTDPGAARMRQRETELLALAGLKMARDRPGGPVCRAAGEEAGPC